MATQINKAVEAYNAFNFDELKKIVRLQQDLGQKENDALFKAHEAGKEVSNEDFSELYNEIDLLAKSIDSSWDGSTFELKIDNYTYYIYPCGFISEIEELENSRAMGQDMFVREYTDFGLDNIHQLYSLAGSQCY